MSEHDPSFNWQPSPEQLSAFVDGELDETASARVEAWLTDHAEAAREVDQYRRLSSAFRTTSAPLPAEDAWRKTWQGIAARQTRAAGKTRGWRSPWARFVLGTLAAAAALVAFLLVNRMTPVTPPHHAHDGESSEPPFVVATDDDVHIETVHADDVPALVVGQLPLPGPLALAATDDIQLLDVQPGDDGRVPDMRWFESWPVVVVPPAEPKEEN